MCSWLYLGEMSYVNMILIQRGLFWFIKYECLPLQLSLLLFELSLFLFLLQQLTCSALECARSKTHDHCLHFTDDGTEA